MRKKYIKSDEFPLRRFVWFGSKRCSKEDLPNIYCLLSLLSTHLIEADFGDLHRSDRIEETPSLVTHQQHMLKSCLPQGSRSDSKWLSNNLSPKKNKCFESRTWDTCRIRTWGPGNLWSSWRKSVGLQIVSKRRTSVWAPSRASWCLPHSSNIDFNKPPTKGRELLPGA